MLLNMEKGQTLLILYRVHHPALFLYWNDKQIMQLKGSLLGLEYIQEHFTRN